MRVEELGELRLIDRIKKLVADEPRSRAVHIGLGDDAAVLRLPQSADLVVSTDCSVEGTHFRWGTHAPEVVGGFAMAANLSDLAAMGATPVAFTLALAIPPRLEVRCAEGLVRGSLRLARRFGCALVGGNIARAPQTALTITVLGQVPEDRALRRDRARPGDRIFVTGSFGGSALRRLRAEQRATRIRTIPEPRILAGLALRRLPGIGACIDVSDGLVPDLRQVLRASRVDARIDPERVPTPRGFVKQCLALEADPLSIALGGGEDYELLFTLRGKKIGAEALSRKLQVPVTEIGEITLGGKGELPAIDGWEHF